MLRIRLERLTNKTSKGDSEIDWITVNIPSNSGTLNIQKNDLENVEVFFNNNIRHNKKVQFVKMHYKTRSTLTPWSNVNECKKVQEKKYSSVHFFTKELGDSQYGKHVVVLPNSIEKLCFARDKITIWKSRC